jgi:hypothetical protein
MIIVTNKWCCEWIFFMQTKSGKNLLVSWTGFQPFSLCNNLYNINNISSSLAWLPVNGHIYPWISWQVFTGWCCQHHAQPPTWRTRPPYVWPPETGWPSCTPRHWVTILAWATFGLFLSCDYHTENKINYGRDSITGRLQHRQTRYQLR